MIATDVSPLFRAAFLRSRFKVTIPSASASKVMGLQQYAVPL